jgi:hypothetical protein
VPLGASVAGLGALPLLFTMAIISAPHGFGAIKVLWPFVLVFASTLAGGLGIFRLGRRSQNSN